MRNILLSLIFLIFSYTLAVAQEGVNEPEMIEVIPPSPEASEFLDRSNMEVNEFVGKPNINIPIHTIKMNNFSWPISLSYDAGGLKVEEVASWVGAGWTLNATALIGRTVKQHPDELAANFSLGTHENYGYFSSAAKKLYNASGQVIHSLLATPQDDQISDPSLIQNYETVTYADSIADGYIDTQPDLYHYSIGANSGKFYFNQDLNIIELKKSNMTFQDYPFKDGTFPADLLTADDYEWTLVDEKGITYIFQKAERTHVATQSDFVNEIDYSDYQSSWYLTKIISSSDVLTFNYEDESHYLEKLYSENRKYSVAGEGSEPESLTNQSFTTNGHRLKSISSNRGDRIEFIESEDNRADYDGKSLDSIKIYKNNILIKTYIFNKSYFGESYQTKLRLDALTEKIDGFEKPPYQFEYFLGSIQNSEFPDITNREQDYWGYFNNNGSTTLIPEYKDDSYHFKTFTADRTPNLQYAKIGTLERLIYPTGGVIDFVYELNEVYNENKKQTYYKEVQAPLGTFTSPNTDEEIFTIPEQTYGTLEFSEIEGLGGGISSGTYAHLYKKNGSDQYVVYTPPSHSNQYAHRIVLEAGVYKLAASNDGGGSNSMVTVSLEYELIEPGNEKVGGLRISDIKYLDDIENQNLVKHTKYHYNQSGTETSSGVLFQEPYFGGYTTDYYDQGVLTKSLNVNSYASKILSYQGSHVGYQEVIVEDKDLNQGGHGVPGPGGMVFPNGRKEIEFIALQPENTVQHPYVGEQFLEHRNGSIKKEEDYVMDSPEPVQRKEYFYHDHEYSPFVIPVKGFREVRRSNYTSFPPVQYAAITYKPAYQYLDSIRQTKYDEMGHELQTTTRFEYDKSILKPIKIHTINDLGEVKEKVMSWKNWPGLLDQIAEFDYSIGDASLNSLSNKVNHRKSYQKFNYSGTQLQSKYEGVLDDINPNFSGDNILSDSLSSLFPQFHQTYSSSRNGSGNIIYESLPREGGVKKYYQWDENGIYPIAQLITYSENDYFKVFNFEYEQDNLSVGATGSKAKIGPTTLSFTNIPTGDYYLTYKAKKHNGTGEVIFNSSAYNQQITNEDWQYFRYKFTNSEISSLDFEINLYTIIDDVCIYPVNTELNTYTYQDGKGITSITDTNGNSTFYQYDYNNENITIIELDNDKNVLKRMETKYKNFDQ
jgi:hypothetical protein